MCTVKWGRRGAQREPRGWDSKVGKRVNSEVNIMPNRYRAREEGVDGGDRGGECSWFVQSGGGEERSGD